MNWLCVIYAVLGWLIVALGMLHMFSTLRLSDPGSLSALWFLGTGLAMTLVGVLNLLNRAYGARARGLTIACVVANAVLAIFTILGSQLTGASLVETALVCGGMLLATVLSAAPAALSASR